MAIICDELKSGHRLFQLMFPSAYPVPVHSGYSSEPFPVVCCDGSKSLHIPNFRHVVLPLLCSTHPASRWFSFPSNVTSQIWVLNVHPFQQSGSIVGSCRPQIDVAGSQIFFSWSVFPSVFLVTVFPLGDHFPSALEVTGAEDQHPSALIDA